MSLHLTPVRYRTLLAAARRQARGRMEADDLLNEALAVALAGGRSLSEIGEAWLAGVMRNLSRMDARTARRRRVREEQFSALAPPAGEMAKPSMPDLDGLSPALRVVALLALAGHSRAEIRLLLRLSDEALRQRIAGIRRHLRGDGGIAPGDFPALAGTLAYGAIRRSLLPMTRQGTALLASHDPDGHPIAFSIFPGTDSQNRARRQQGT